MHYILLSIALNLGKENVNVMKTRDLKSSTVSIAQVPVKNDKKKAEILPNLNIDDELTSIAAFTVDTEEFTTPYIESDSFADLLPESETDSIVKAQEEQGPKFLESVKNKLISATQTKDSQTILGDQIEGPSFIDNIKERILKKSEADKSDKIVLDKTETVVKSKDETPTAIDGQIAKTNLFDKIGDKVGDRIATTDIKGEAGKIIESIKDKTTTLTSKITEATSSDKQELKDKVDKSNKDNIADEKKVKIVGTLFDSELNQAKKDESKSQILRDRPIQEDLIYQEDESYEKFLNDKDIDKLTRPEKILIPFIVPKEKQLSTFKTQEVPQELLEPRKFDNRHIPLVMQNKEKQNLLEKIIEYGMLAEFKAFLKEELMDANDMMSNQYTLLTYATKHKQYDIIKYLIYKGADVNKRDERLDTPLLIAVKNNDLAGVKLLTNSNADLNKIDITKRTPLILAIEKNYDNIAIYLIDSGADIDTKNGVGEGTLAMSIRLGRVSVKEKLLSVLNKNISEKSVNN